MYLFSPFLLGTHEAFQWGPPSQSVSWHMLHQPLDVFYLIDCLHVSFSHSLLFFLGGVRLRNLSIFKTISNHFNPLSWISQIWLMLMFFLYSSSLFVFGQNILSILSGRYLVFMWFSFSPSKTQNHKGRLKILILVSIHCIHWLYLV